jgi:hypothetical protein
VVLQADNCKPPESGQSHMQPVHGATSGWLHSCPGREHFFSLTFKDEILASLYQSSTKYLISYFNQRQASQ